jgi:hypothetical protein
MASVFFAVQIMLRSRRDSTWSLLESVSGLEVVAALIPGRQKTTSCERLRERKNEKNRE